MLNKMLLNIYSGDIADSEISDAFMTKDSELGLEEFTYDNYNRLTSQKLDGTVMATPSYDSYGRLASVAYNNAASMNLAIGRDSLGRTTNHDYTLGNGTSHHVDTVTRSQSGQITGGTELGQTKSYTYDKAGRLTNATIGSNTYAYNFTTNSCTGTSNNPNSYRNSNRKSDTMAILLSRRQYTDI